MPVQSTNPDYDAHIAEWKMMDDALEGECAVKRNQSNLPKPSGMVEAEKQTNTCMRTTQPGLSTSTGCATRCVR
ncbi:Putative phage protein [Pseudomonas brassicacearum subsp. brassicacearum NFM421]|uniref:Putative phage protein n=1 Tax=Pseudomonas brassicacearum (strain NFM421) TaxID=994484 RepID=F2KJG4_PSEBN|nr:Putative phage protein [Pseudomonas brassicacearum subsp. brassicacearum NFM421]